MIDLLITCLHSWYRSLSLSPAPLCGSYKFAKPMAVSPQCHRKQTCLWWHSGRGEGHVKARLSIWKIDVAIYTVKYLYVYKVKCETYSAPSQYLAIFLPLCLLVSCAALYRSSQPSSTATINPMLHPSCSVFAAGYALVSRSFWLKQMQLTTTSWLFIALLGLTLSATAAQAPSLLPIAVICITQN